MPGYVLHLAHGKMITDMGAPRFNENDMKKLQLGLLAPDAVGSGEKRKTHFWSDEEENRILQIPDINAFADKYTAVMDNPFVLGYAAHLYLDKMFFSDYFLSCVSFLDKDGKETMLKNDVCGVYLKSCGKSISTDELFSEEYLYGDYTKLNRYISQKYNISVPEYTHISNPIEEVNTKDIIPLLRNLEQYLCGKTEPTDDKPHVFTEDGIENALRKYAVDFLNKKA